MKKKFKVLSLIICLLLIAQISAVTLAKQSNPTDDTTDETTEVQEKNQNNKANGLGQLTKEERKQLQRERIRLRQQIRACYTQEELDNLLATANSLRERYGNIKVLPCDSIISNKYGFKFDVPPVIKEGRTLIPVRAITEGLGADVSWDQETKTVTIVQSTTSSSITIEMILDEKTVKVNGEAVELDTKATLYNNRTFVPVRFIAETFGLKVNWYGEDETIEILDEDDDEKADTEEDDENNEDDEE